MSDHRDWSKNREDAVRLWIDEDHTRTDVVSDVWGTANDACDDCEDDECTWAPELRRYALIEVYVGPNEDPGTNRFMSSHDSIDHAKHHWQMLLADPHWQPVVIVDLDTNRPVHLERNYDTAANRWDINAVVDESPEPNYWTKLMVSRWCLRTDLWWDRNSTSPDTDAATPEAEAETVASFAFEVV